MRIICLLYLASAPSLCPPIPIALVLVSHQPSLTAGEDYIVNQQDLQWAEVKDGAKIYPWMVRMSMTRLDETTVQCGGTLISKDRIATARHCLQNMKSGVVEFLKKTSSDNGNFTRQIKYYQIPKDRVSDYAEAVLDKPVRNIFPIDICQGKPKAGKKGVALGWGGQGYDQPWPKYLRRARLQIAYWYDFDGRFFFTKTKYGRSKNLIKDPCGGDSGGPFLHRRSQNQCECKGDGNKMKPCRCRGDYCLLGTVSGFGYDCKKGAFSPKFNGYGRWNYVGQTMAMDKEKFTMLVD